MMTLQGMRERTAWMMEKMRRDAIDEEFETFKKACRNYYKAGCDNGELTASIKKLEGLGVSMDVIFDEEWKIREELEV